MVLEDQDLQVLARAYDRAWDRFLRAGLLTPENLSQSRELLAKGILDAARGGVRDEWRMARNALDMLLRSDFAAQTRTAARRPPARRPTRRLRHGWQPRPRRRASTG
jgi:hypothetical protein